MRYPINWQDDDSIKKVFVYQTRIGVAPKFGNRPISWYQAHQCHAHDIIISKAHKVGIAVPFDVKCSHGILMVGNAPIASVNAVWREADTACRQ